MANTKKRVLSLLMALVMTLGLLPTTAFAEVFDNQVGAYVGYNGEGAMTADRYATQEEAVKTLEDGKLTMSKSITQTAKDEFDITLVVTTAEDLEQVPLSQDAAVVLLIDASASMYDNDAGTGNVRWDRKERKWKYDTKVEDQRITKAKEAAKTFVSSFVKDDKDQPVEGKRMVAVGAFNSDAWRVQDWIDANDTTNGEANRTTIGTAIDNITLSSSTNPDAALQLADNLLGNNAVEDIASRFVILLTDGQPNAKKSGNGDSQYVGEASASNMDAALAAADTASNLKTNRKATLYTLAFATADLECYEGDTCVNCQKGYSEHDKVELCEHCQKTKAEHVELCKNCAKTEGEHSGNRKYCNGTSGERWDAGQYCPQADGTYSKNDDDYEGKCFRKCQGQDTFYNATVTVGAWLASIASPGCYKNAATGESISIKFAEILQQIRKLLQAWQVTDPMGQFINFAELSKKNDNVTLTRENSADETSRVTSLNWNLWDETAVKFPDNDEKDVAHTYTYTLTYTVKLDTSAEGFAEKVKETIDGVETETDKYYPTNGATKLTYVVDPLNADGSLNTNAELKQNYFNVPSVKGTVPTYEYTVNYYKWDKKTEAYPATPTHTDGAQSAKLHTMSPAPAGYMNKYLADGYSFTKAEPALSVKITADKTANVVNLYYKPDATAVKVVHHYLTLTTLDDQSVNVQEITTPDVVPAYLGDSYTATATDKTANGGFDFVETYTVNGTTYTSTENKYLSKLVANGVDENGQTIYNNVIDLYYTKEIDGRTQVPYTVNHTFRDWRYDLVNGKYELKSTDDVRDPVPGTGSHGASVTGALLAHDGYNVMTDAAARTITLDKAGTNVINVLYEKPAAETLVPTTYVVNRHYTTISVSADGNNTEYRNTVTVNGEKENGYVGETYTVNESAYQVYENVTYPVKSGNVTSVKLGSDATKNVIDLYYELDARTPVTVTVNHTYNTYEQVIDMDEASENYGKAVWVLKGEPEVTGGTVTGTFYQGQSYTANPESNGFTLVSVNGATGSDMAAAYTNVKLTAGNNTFQFVYDARPSDNELDPADVTVVHHYRTYRTYINAEGQFVEEELSTDPSKTFDVSEETVRGKVGEFFTAEAANKDGYVWQTKSDMTVRLTGANGKFDLYYVAVDESELYSATVTVVRHYGSYNTYIDAATGEEKTSPWTESETDVAMSTVYGNDETKWYQGQFFTANPADYTDYADYTFENGNHGAPFTAVKLTGESTTIDLYYAKPVDQRVKANVIVRDTVNTTTYSVENGQVVSNATSVTTERPAVEKYVDQFYTAQAKALGAPQADQTIQVAATEVTVNDLTNVQYIDFVYTLTNSLQDASVVVTHKFAVYDWNGTLLPDMGGEKTDTKVTQKALTWFTPTLSTEGGKYRVVKAENSNDNTWVNGETYTMELAAGESNTITLYYELHLDLRQESMVQVTHHYKAKDTYTNVETDEGVFTETLTSYLEDELNFDATGIYVGAGYTATLRTVNGSNTYAYVSSSPDGYTIIIETPVFNETPENPMILTNNLIDIYYLRTFSSEPGPVDPPVPPPVVDDDDDDDDGYPTLPPVVIPDDPTPTTDLPEEEVPTTELPDEEVPLADVPATGDDLAMWVLAAAVSGLGLVWLVISKKRGEESAE